MHKELSSAKTRAQCDIEELKEHLRLVYKALETSPVEEHLDVGDNDNTLCPQVLRERTRDGERFH